MTIAFDEWLTALEQAAVPRERPKDSITAAEFAAKSNIPERSAKYILEQAVKNGKASKLRCVVDGHSTSVYVPKA